MSELPRIDHPSIVVDADGHILEAADLWQTHLEAKYRDRALCIRRDDRGLEYLEINGKPSKRVRNGMPAGLGAMDLVGGIKFERPKTGCDYVDNAPLGAMDAKERVTRLDLEGIDKAILYPTLGVLWVAECDDEELTQAYVRAYNRWIVEFCSDSGGRLLPIAQLSLGDPIAAEKELRRAAADGAIGVWVPPFTWTRIGVGHPDHDRVFAAAEELNMPFGIHPSFEPSWAAPPRYAEMRGGKYSFFENVTAADAIRHAFTSFFQYGVFEKFPQLKLVILESGASWIGYWLDRLDTVYQSPQGVNIRAQLPEKPSTYFRRQCYISADPDETTLAAIIPLIGQDRFFWASDFPHPDHAPDYISHLKELVAGLSDSARDGILGLNVTDAYGL